MRSVEKVGRFLAIVSVFVLDRQTRDDCYAKVLRKGETVATAVNARHLNESNDKSQAN